MLFAVARLVCQRTRLGADKRFWPGRWRLGSVLLRLGCLDGGIVGLAISITCASVRGFGTSVFSGAWHATAVRQACASTRMNSTMARGNLEKSSGHESEPQIHFYGKNHRLDGIISSKFDIRWMRRLEEALADRAVSAICSPGSSGFTCWCTRCTSPSSAWR